MTRVLATLKYNHEPQLLIALYTLLFDIMSEELQDWGRINEVLSEAFSIVPAEFQRKLWAFRMVVSSKQGRNVTVAMSKMRESQATAQANVWLILAHSSSKTADQYDAYVRVVH